MHPASDLPNGESGKNRCLCDLTNHPSLILRLPMVKRGYLNFYSFLAFLCRFFILDSILQALRGSLRGSVLSGGGGEHVTCKTCSGTKFYWLGGLITRTFAYGLISVTQIFGRAYSCFPFSGLPLDVKFLILYLTTGFAATSSPINEFRLPPS